MKIDFQRRLMVFMSICTLISGNSRVISPSGQFFRFSWHTIWWMCRAFTICLLTQRPRLSGPPRYLGRVRKTYKKFSRPTVGKNWEIGWEKFFEKCECEPTRSNWEKELSRFSEKSNNVKRMIKSTTKSKPRKATMLQV